MGKILDPGDIMLLEPGEATDFFALTDAVRAVVKLSSARGDKYPGHFHPQSGSSLSQDKQ